MSEHTPEEEALREVASAAAASSSTNPWRPVREMLALHAETAKTHAIGIQDSTVIDRAIGSPKTMKPERVHSFVVRNPRAPRRPAARETIVARLENAIQQAPYITTAVVLPYWNDFYPSDILASSDTEMAQRLGAAYPHADMHDGIVKTVNAQLAQALRGPWVLQSEDVAFGDDGSVTIGVDDPDGDLRSVYPGDAVAVIEGSQPKPWGVGRVHHMRRGDGSGHILVVLDRFARVVASGPTADEVTP